MAQQGHGDPSLVEHSFYRCDLSAGERSAEGLQLAWQKLLAGCTVA